MGDVTDTAGVGDVNGADADALADARDVDLEGGRVDEDGELAAEGGGGFLSVLQLIGVADVFGHFGHDAVIGFGAALDVFHQLGAVFGGFHCRAPVSQLWVVGCQFSVVSRPG
ncbi:MAG: hypothetical protein ACREGR_00325 [Minisyncoccia bacterium]